MYPDIKFNCIVIIQSMDDPKPGQEIERTIRYTCMREDLEDNMVQLFNVVTKRDLFELLYSIYVQSKFSNCKPFLHFEMHGSEDGIVLRSGERIIWKGLEII